MKNNSTDFDDIINISHMLDRLWNESTIDGWKITVPQMINALKLYRMGTRGHRILSLNEQQFKNLIKLWRTIDVDTVNRIIVREDANGKEIIEANGKESIFAKVLKNIKGGDFDFDKYTPEEKEEISKLWIGIEELDEHSKDPFSEKLWIDWILKKDYTEKFTKSDLYVLSLVDVHHIHTLIILWKDFSPLEGDYSDLIQKGETFEDYYRRSIK